MITDEQIEAAKERTKYSLDAPEHVGNDGIRIAYEWLDAQKKISQPRKTCGPVKHIIECWSGCYISQSDVEVAATLHKNIEGKYPSFNLSARLTEPRHSRLDDIPKKKKSFFDILYQKQYDTTEYSRKEQE